MTVRTHTWAWVNHAALNVGAGLLDLARAAQCAWHVFVPPQFDHSPETIASLAEGRPVIELLRGLGLRS